LESVSTPNTTSNESNTNTTSITTSNNINEKGDLNSHAIYENGEFQLIEHLLHQQEIDKEATKEEEEEEESKINLTQKTPLTNENDTEIVLVREEEQLPKPSSQFQASTLPPRYNQQNQPIINQTKIRTTTSTDYTKHAMNSSLPFASFQPGQASNILQQRNENFLKNSTNIITNLSPMANHRPLPQVPTKPRTIITLPHLRNRNQNQQQQQSLSQNSSQIINQTTVNKTPIIIRERIEPPTLSISTPTTVNITNDSSTSSSSNIITSPINSNKNENSNQMNRISSSSSPSTNSSSTNQIYSTSSSSNSSSPASSTSSQNSVPITIASRQTQNSQVCFNPVVSPTLTNKASNNNHNETANNTANNVANIEYSPLKSSLQNKIVMNAATFSPSNNFTYEINSSKLNPIINTLSGSNDRSIINTRDTSQTNTESGAFMTIENKYVRVNSSPKSTIGVF
jgi:hypothetical protein